MTRLGTVAIVIRTLVVRLGDSHIKQTFRTLYLTADFGQVGNLQRGAVLLDNLHQRDVVEVQFAILGTEFILRKIESLINQIIVLVLHEAVLFIKSDSTKSATKIQLILITLKKKSQSDKVGFANSINYYFNNLHNRGADAVCIRAPIILFPYTLIAAPHAGSR